ncbi:MAG: hypothetical protein DRR08_33705 [Candidatus Parabeggiatoa sp. nov. 2]|nr:MAG: hypothetical protein B6247_22345 [Beggiatoa sp. 4572_84]RKZ45974.1 MAG: hypothetical protein DRR08_33705 [Gammaproteobacteria bacterium]
MKELSILVEVSKGKIPAQFLSLTQGEEGTQVKQGDLLEEVSTITVLDEILTQDDSSAAVVLRGQNMKNMTIIPHSDNRQPPKK